MLIKVQLQFDDLKTLFCHLGTEILRKGKKKELCLQTVMQRDTQSFTDFSLRDFSDVNSPFVLLCTPAHFQHYLSL